MTIYILIALGCIVLGLYIASHIFVTRLMNGKLTGTYDGLLGQYILNTFRYKDLYHRGEGLPVVLTDSSTTSENRSGTIIFLGEVNKWEQRHCSIDYFEWEVKGFWWTKQIYKNFNFNEFGRFDDNKDELLTVPFWYFQTKTLSKVLLVLGLILMLIPSVIRASNYNPELIKLHKELSTFEYDFHAMPSQGSYRQQHTLKHFVGKGKPLPAYTGETPYGKRNSAAIVSIVAQPNAWQVCNATDEFPEGNINHKIGLWNNDWKLFMVFGSVSKPIQGQAGGVLVSAYVEKQGTRKIKCNWDNPDYSEYRLLQYQLKQLIPKDVNLEEISQPIFIGATIAGVIVAIETVGSVLASLVLGSI